MPPSEQIAAATKARTTWAVALLLGLGLFAFDLVLPLGYGNAPLYAIPVWVSLFLRDRRAPVILASYATGLLILGYFWSPVLPESPAGIAIPNRLFGIILIWVSVWFKLERLRTQETLERMNNELEMRVRERTQELEDTNCSLQAEIREREKTEQVLRAHEAALEESQEALQRSQEDLEQLAGDLLTAQEDERRRIAHDLHDDVNQRLALLALDVRGMEQKAGTEADWVKAGLRSLLQRTVQLSDDIRTMAYRFHPSILDDLGLATALQHLVDDFSTRTGIKTVLVCEELPTSLREDTATVLYRVVQESLSNIAKHANACRVEIELITDDQALDLSIRDNGCGFDVESSGRVRKGMGLMNMKERVRSVQGTFDLWSQPGQGTRIRVTVPMPVRQT
jgi:signal transduction histidine kinase